MKTLRKLLGTAVDFVAPHRSYITLLVVAIAAAALYAWGAFAHAKVDNLTRWIESTCAIAGADKHPGNPKGQKDRGVDCVKRVQELADFERDTNAGTAKVLIDALDERNRKTNNDARTAAEQAAAARAAAERMEAANAAVGDDDRVGGDWFDALNRSAGLRAPKR